jgi:5'-3' exonuclease
MGLKRDFSDQESFLLIDNSYLVHAIACRTINIYGNHYDIPDLKTPEGRQELYTIDFSLDEDFMHIFKRNYLSVIKKLHREHLAAPSRTVYAMDCKKRDIWRRSHFEEYKLHRIVQIGVPEGLNRGPIFGYVNKNLLPLLEESGFGYFFHHPASEGDDIIAITHALIRENEPNRKIVILGSDHDLMQLLDHNTEIYTTQGKSMRDKSRGDRKEDLMLKILKGDGSDGIPACFSKVKGDSDLSRGFGTVAATRFLEDKELLMRKFQQYPEAITQFKLNNLLVDFRNIPEQIKTDVRQQLNEKIFCG